jgi:hypothetical protein
MRSINPLSHRGSVMCFVYEVTFNIYYLPFLWQKTVVNFFETVQFVHEIDPNYLEVGHYQWKSRKREGGVVTYYLVDCYEL